MALGGAGPYLGSSKAQAQPGAGPTGVAANSPNGPDIVRLLGPVVVNTDLRDLPYIPSAPRLLRRPTSRHAQAETGAPSIGTSTFAQLPPLITGIVRPVPTMPPPLLTFAGTSSAEGGNSIPPDTNGDVGPNHYVQAVNQAFKVFNKNGKTLSGPTTFDSFFAPLGKNTPCGLSQMKLDPVVFYDQIADRWIITDHAQDWEETTFWECIGVSQTGDPVTGGWFLYALQDDPVHPNRMGDYPKYGLWPDAYYLTMIEPGEHVIHGVQVYALDRASMIGGGPTNAVGFTIDRTALGDSHTLIPASFRTGAAPPSGRQEFLLAIDDPREGVTQTHVKGWLFHVDFVNPSNSTLGLGSDHSPNAQITVNGFINAPPYLVPQQGTDRKLDTLGDRIMTPVVYQNRNGTESLWADHTIILNYPDGPTAIRWYQFNVTGGNLPSTPVQQQDWSNGNDGLWRWMPSIAVDQNGNTAIGYSICSPSMFPGIRYAGRFATDPLNGLGQGEAIMTNGRGSQTLEIPRWGDYTMTTIDPADGITFWHTNEYYIETDAINWSTRIGKFQLANPKSTLENISARGFVQTGDKVMIGGFMVQGTEPKRVIIRAIGPELTQYGVPDALANPTLELYDGTGALIASNNNWATTIIGGIITSNQVHEIQASGYAPGDALESAIIADLPAGNYTAIVSGVNNMTGVGLVEVYNLGAETNSILGNISTRSFVQTGDNVMIGGFMVQGGQPKRVIIRAIGPELTQYGVPDALANPTLELYDRTGALIASNNNWVTTIIGGIITGNQVHEIQASGYAPGSPFESAIIADLPAGNYTAVVRGVNNMTGVALVEVYDLQ
jgi:hypothetical protein